MANESTEKTTFMFPGQGSQYLGMRHSLGLDQGPAADLFHQADDILGFPLSRIIEEGPEDLLVRTDNAQPALLVTEVAVAKRLGDLGHQADLVMGHSLGQYSALVHAGALDFRDALKLVRLRGVLMNKANERAPGGMAAVIGVKIEDLAKVVDQLSDMGVLEITNLNAPTQVVVSGENRAVFALVDFLREHKMGRAVPLNVSAPFHSSLMAPIAEDFAQALDSVEIRRPSSVFLDNVTGEPEDDPERIRENLVLQLTKPVLWSASVQKAWDLGARTFVECGPKKVLSGLVRRTVRGANLVSAESLLGSV